MTNQDEDLKAIKAELGNINERLSGVEDAMANNRKLVDGIQTDMNQMQVDIEDINVKLKKVLSKMRKPNKLCLDISLSFILAVLVGTLVWIIRAYFNISPL